MELEPWYKVATPREDLRKGEPLDAARFAVHLDQVLDGTASREYRDATQLFSKTFLTEGLTELIGEVERRLSGEKLGSSPVISLTTQFGGGKTHALTLLYHLANTGPQSKKFHGVDKVLLRAKITTIPKARVAAFVGTAFDFIAGKSEDGGPKRTTPWGEIAWQLGGLKAFKEVEEHDKRKTAPGKDVIRRILPKDEPALILMDEVLNFMSRARTERVGSGASTLATQFYSFLQNLSEEVTSRTGVCLVLSLPKSEREMSVDDEEDFRRLEKLTERVGKPYVLSEGLEIAEIVRQRLFEEIGDVSARRKAAKAYAEWLVAHRDLIPTWFPVDKAQETIEATYPFHPVVLSVFERKWQALPQFQRTRGVLRMLALWVSKAYSAGFKGAHKEALLSLGSAPLEDPLFRAQVFDQLGQNLEAAVTSDISGREAHAVRLDEEASDSIKANKLHRKVATSVFFESSGGQIRQFATEPEVRLGVSEPGLEIGDVETVLEDLANECYHLTGEGKRFWISPSPNLNKLLADRKATIDQASIESRVRQEIEDVFSKGAGIEKIYFPRQSNQVPDRPSLVLVVMDPESKWDDTDHQDTQLVLASLVNEHGTSARTYKSALIFAIADHDNSMLDEARKLLAWEAIRGEADSLRLSETQLSYLKEQFSRSQRDFKESIWRAYKNILLLGKGNQWERVDLGLVHSSAAESIIRLILNRLRQDGHLVSDIVSPSFLVRNWPPAFPEWATRAVRDAFFASPQLPRLVNPDSLKETIAKGVTDGLFGYAERAPNGSYLNVRFGKLFISSNVEFADDVFILPKEVASALQRGTELGGGTTDRAPAETQPNLGLADTSDKSQGPIQKELTASRISWEGQVAPQKWMTLYTKVLSKFPIGDEMSVRVNVIVEPKQGISKQKIEEVKSALRNLGLSDDVQVTEKSGAESEGQ